MNLIDNFESIAPEKNCSSVNTHKKLPDQIFLKKSQSFDEGVACVAKPAAGFNEAESSAAFT
jgi:hypothetical protein